jgi:hypothetical protein
LEVAVEVPELYHLEVLVYEQAMEDPEVESLKKLLLKIQEEAALWVKDLMEVWVQIMVLVVLEEEEERVVMVDLLMVCQLELTHGQEQEV